MLLAAMILGLLPAYAAAEGPELLCTVGTVGENGICDVAVELVNAEGIAMMQFSLRYDPEKLAFLGSELGTVFTGGLAPTLNTLNSGEIVLSWDSLSPLQSDGTILLLHMRLLGAESATLYFGGDDDLVFARDDFEPIDVSCTGCTIDRPIAAATTVTTPSEHTSVSETPTQVAGPPVVIITSAAQVTAAPAFVTPIHTPVSVTESPTGTAAPGAQTEATPAVFLSPDETQSLTMQDEQITIAPGQTQKIEVVEDKTNLFWSSSDERVATVDENGNVTAHESGTAIITASSEDGTAYASSTVTVNTPAEIEKQQKVQNTPAGEQESTQEQNQENKETPVPEAEAGSSTNSDEAKSEKTKAAFWPVLIALLAVCALSIFFINRKIRLQRLNNMEEKK